MNTRNLENMGVESIEVVEKDRHFLIKGELPLDRRKLSIRFSISKKFRQTPGDGPEDDGILISNIYEKGNRLWSYREDVAAANVGNGNGALAKLLCLADGDNKIYVIGIISLRLELIAVTPLSEILMPVVQVGEEKVVRLSGLNPEDVRDIKRKVAAQFELHDLLSEEEKMARQEKRKEQKAADDERKRMERERKMQERADLIEEIQGRKRSFAFTPEGEKRSGHPIWNNSEWKVLPSKTYVIFEDEERNPILAARVMKNSSGKKELVEKVQGLTRERPDKGNGKSLKAIGEMVVEVEGKKMTLFHLPQGGTAPFRDAGVKELFVVGEPSKDGTYAIVSVSPGKKDKTIARSLASPISS